jgi:signal peptidase I
VEPEAPSGPDERKVLAPMLALLGGPLGHAAIGHWRRGCYWFGVVLALEAGGFAAAIAGKGRLFWALVLLVLAIRFAMLVDAIQLPRRAPQPTRRALFLLWIGLLMFYGVLGGRVRRQFVEFVPVPLADMSPTLLAGEQLAVWPGTDGIRRGDVVTHVFPRHRKVELVKRVIGVGGDTVSGRNAQLFVNGQPVSRRKLEEPCPPGTGGGPGCTLWEETLDGRRWRVASNGSEPDFLPTAVPPGTYFLVGDNRGDSNDSRYLGSVDRELITGLPRFVSMSSDWGRLGQPVK